MRPADGILPPGIPGYNEDLAGLDYDIELARELIASSKYGDVSNLPPITITDSGQGGLISADLEAIIYEWRENLGVEVEWDVLDIVTAHEMASREIPALFFVALLL